MTVKQAWNKKIAQWVGTILAVISLTSIAWGIIIVPQVKDISRIEAEACVGKKIELLISQNNEISKNQIATDLKVSALKGEIEGLKLFLMNHNE